MNWGSFAGGFAKTFDSKAVGGAINEGMMTSGLEENEAAHKAAIDEANYKEFDDAGAEINRYDDATRKQKIADADKAFKEANEKTVRKWKGAKGLQEWKSTQMQNDAAEMELNKAKTIQGIYDDWDSGEAFKNQGNIDNLNATKTFLSAFMPELGRGEFAYQNGQLGVMDNGKFNVVAPGTLQFISRVGATMSVFSKTGDYGALAALTGIMGKRSDAINDHERTGIYAASQRVHPASDNSQKNPFSKGATGIPKGTAKEREDRKDERKEAIPAQGGG